MCVCVCMHVCVCLNTLLLGHSTLTQALHPLLRLPTPYSDSPPLTQTLHPYSGSPPLLRLSTPYSDSPPLTQTLHPLLRLSTPYSDSPPFTQTLHINLQRSLVYCTCTLTYPNGEGTQYTRVCACMHVCMCTCHMQTCAPVCTFVCTCVCVHACVHVYLPHADMCSSVYVCMQVCVFVHTCNLSGAVRVGSDDMTPGPGVWKPPCQLMGVRVQCRVRACVLREGLAESAHGDTVSCQLPYMDACLCLTCPSQYGSFHSLVAMKSLRESWQSEIELEEEVTHVAALTCYTIGHYPGQAPCSGLQDSGQAQTTINSYTMAMSLYPYHTMHHI